MTNCYITIFGNRQKYSRFRI
nr:unnamed protein product [Callosobruchus analis]